MRFRLNLLLAAVVPMVLASCVQFPTYRYRLTVAVDTPEGLRQGSSVIQVKTHDGIGFPGPDANRISASVKGEAVVVDLGRRGLLFALLRNATSIAQLSLLPVRVDKGGTAKAASNNLRAMKLVAGRADVPVDSQPMLVRFRDVRDPKSVEMVDADDLASAFGPGVRLRRITVEISDDAVTELIEKYLPWLGTSVQGYLDGQPLGGGPQLSNILDTTDFKRKQ